VREDQLAALPPITDAGRGERLQRVLADAGVASRRACEELIAEGRVTVNGQTVDALPAWVHPELDRVEVDGRPIPRPERRLYLMLNKPARTLTTAADEPGSQRQTVLDLIDHPSRARLFPVGRLDYETLGLVLLTNDGDLAHRLTHPRFGVEKTYRAMVRGLLDDEAVAGLEEGIYLAERKAGRTVGAARTARVEIRVVRRERDRTVLEIKLREGRNRQVRRMLASVGCPVRKLERVAMGPLHLKGLARGEWRELDRHELRAIRAAALRGKGDSDETGEATTGSGRTPKKKTAKKTISKKPIIKKPIARKTTTKKTVTKKKTGAKMTGGRGPTRGSSRGPARGGSRREGRA